jgi:EAL domain-containing protein (putative c-di-GMP-specific phosphodiesterase class I)/YHS domain-containing protein
MKNTAQAARGSRRGSAQAGVPRVIGPANRRQRGESGQVSGDGSPPSAGSTVVIDPVCGMAVDQGRSVSIEHDGRLWFFCSRGCRDEFLGVMPMEEATRAEELIRRVLDEPELLRAVFQPIVSLGTGRVVAYEALARFAPVPLQPPEAWFDLAARAGLTPELEALALRTALAVVDMRPPPAGAFVSLNVSPLLLDDPRIAPLLAAPSVRPEGIVLELTERDRVADYDALRTTLAPYRARGFRVAVDDAGAGYASLRHITELRPDFVKLDARLIQGLTGDPARQALVRAMSTFVDEVGAVLVAEGVEQLEDLDLLVQVGRPMLVQGFALGRASEPWPAASEFAVRHLGDGPLVSEAGSRILGQ